MRRDAGGPDGAAIAELSLITAAEAGDLADRVGAMSQHWTRRHLIAPFYTLGAAAYIDAQSDPDRYFRALAVTNPILQSAFNDLYVVLVGALSRHLGQTVRTTSRFALPGFHIYLPFEIFREDIASLHWDRQHTLLPWDEDRVPNRLLSLTLPLACPIGGCGLKLWRWRHDDGPAQRERHLADPGPAHIHHTYQPGRLILHDGQHLHQAELMPNRPFADTAAPGLDRRITLQAHLARCDGFWELYW